MKTSSSTSTAVFELLFVAERRKRKYSCGGKVALGCSLVANGDESCTGSSGENCRKQAAVGAIIEYETGILVRFF